ncbi:BTAD domain-containing putative transcriptional regulator [Planomonospora sp. ID67723]|uniref:AfsR/SARP family transcriptional regulator n=1 Tax=Planomonospora sp. ID67723 TaxID=2738134 RepID=UPI0018C3B3AE|nr:BTAD domain-containing putative transcriptional regulator [Planomonospora sp. ID67723]
MLGPLELWTAGGPVDLGPPRQRAVWAAVAVDAPRPVPADTMIDRVWGEAPPERARHALQVYLARIRRVLERVDAGGPQPARLTRRSGGYALDIEPDSVDAHRFRRLVGQARNQQCARTEAELLRQALGLWRGVPLGGVEGDWAARVRQAWHRQHLDAAARWAHAELCLGDAAAVIDPISDLLLENPLAEPLVTVLMRALYAGGRIPEALGRYAEFRRRLADQLGLDPGDELRELHQTILRGDPDAAGPPPAPPAPADPAPPAQLPLDVCGFTGRCAEIARLDALLAQRADQPTAVPVSVLSGTAGVGKTALAVHWAHRVAGRFPDGQLYVNLRGFAPNGPAMEPGEALRGFLHALAVPAARLPPDLDAQTALYRSLLARRRMLLVLDNARDAEQVRPLLPGAPGCLVLVTSRNQLTSLIAVEGARPLALDPPALDEARRLLARRLGAERAAAEPGAVDEIISRCARLPLALAVVAARAVGCPAFPLAAFADELRDEHARLDVLSAGDEAGEVRAVLSWSYRTLSAPAARMFRLLGLAAGTDLATAAAASLAGVTAQTARALLAELAAASLVTEHRPGRFTAHDLLRSYSAELVQRDDEAGRRAATHRLLDHYLHTAQTAAALLNPHRDPVAMAEPLPDMTPGHVPDLDRAMCWFTAEHQNLLAAVRQANRSGFDVHTWQLAWTMTDFLNRQGHWTDRVTVQRTALEATGRLGDRPSRIRVLHGLGTTCAQLGRFDEARAHLSEALALAAGHGDDNSRANVHISLALVLEGQGDYRTALEHASQALGLFRAAGHITGQANALNMVGWCHIRLGAYADALTSGEQGLVLQQQTGSRYGQACTLDSIGYAHHHLGHLDLAVDCYQQALTLFRELGERSFEATVLAHLGETHAAAGDDGKARDHWRSALAILDRLGGPDAAAIRERIRHLSGDMP